MEIKISISVYHASDEAGWQSGGPGKGSEHDGPFDVIAGPQRELEHLSRVNQDKRRYLKDCEIKFGVQITRHAKGVIFFDYRKIMGIIFQVFIIAPDPFVRLQ